MSRISLLLTSQACDKYRSMNVCFSLELRSTKPVETKKKSAQETGKAKEDSPENELNKSIISISSDESEKEGCSSTTNLVKSNKISTESGQKVERGFKNLLKECPRASTRLPCERCTIKVDEQSNKIILSCHCGRQTTLPGGRTQNAKAHWATGE